MEVLAVNFVNLGNQLSNYALAALGLGLVIFLHELGHFAVAKWCDVNVERFSIGFGPVFFSRKWGETEYALSLIPFGGYVKMLGQDDADPSQLTSEEIAEDPRSYVAKTVFQRMAIISAGVTMNILTAFLFFIVVFAVGFPTSPAKIGDSRPGMPAWEAGIVAGDKIEKINGSAISIFNDLQMNVALSSGPLKFEGTHSDGKSFDYTVDPDTSHPHPQIGVLPMESLTIHEVVPGHPSSKGTSSFQKGDEVTKVGDTIVKNAVQFHHAVAANPTGTLAITVERKFDKDGKRLANSKTETITTEDNFFRTLGLTLDSGPIAAVQKGSPAEKAGLKKNDKLAKIDGLNIGTDIDPFKLPIEFAKRHGREINVVVTRQNVGGGTEGVSVNLTPNDAPGWLDKPELPGDPLSIPSIGIAFHLLPVVLSVTPDGPADKAGIKPGPLKKMVLLRSESPDMDDDVKDSKIDVVLDDRKTNNCAYAFWLLQRFPNRKIMLSVVEDEKPHEIVPEIDFSWPLPLVGFHLEIERIVQKANTIGEACAMSVKHTRTSALNIYLTLRSLVTGRVSYKELHGPIGIAKTAVRFAQEGVVAMLLFLGFLSVNLAVLNFLPIPVLDGGHMVFLMWEACTRRKPNEKLLIGATYVGFAFLLCLMALVLYLDVFIHGISKK